jgi:MFS family permease
VNVALPSIRDDLGFSHSGLQWIVNAYALALAGFLLLGGRAADLFGRRRMFMVGLGVFTVASLAGGFAQSLSALVTARALQGLGAAVLAPATLTIITTWCPEGQLRTRAIGVWSAVAAAGATSGALLGGLLTDLISWRWLASPGPSTQPQRRWFRTSVSPSRRFSRRCKPCGGGPDPTRSITSQRQGRTSRLLGTSPKSA